jgi:general secretion pathway protein K
MARARTDRGFALLLVVIALATLSLIVAASVEAGRRFGEEASGSVEDLRLRAAADAAFWTAARDLVTASPTILPYKRAFELDGVRLTASARSEAGKIDINAASPELIASLLVQLGLKAKSAARLADEIADWRDGDGDARKSGAEAAEYIAARRSYVPRNEPFETLAELSLVLDGGEDLPDCLARDATVFTRRADIDPDAASPAVLRAAKIDPAASGPPATSIVGGRSVDSGTLIDIAILAEDRGAGRALSEETIVRLTGSRSAPIWVLSRALPEPQEGDVRAACTRLAGRQ